MVNLTLSANDAFSPLHPYPTHLPHLHTILSAMSFFLISRKCVLLSSPVCVCSPQPPLCLLISSMCVLLSCLICVCCPQTSPPPCPFVSSSLVGVCFCPAPSVFAVLRPPLCLLISSMYVPLSCPICVCCPQTPPLSPHL